MHNHLVFTLQGSLLIDFTDVWTFLLFSEQNQASLKFGLLLFLLSTFGIPKEKYLQACYDHYSHRRHSRSTFCW